MKFNKLLKLILVVVLLSMGGKFYAQVTIGNDTSPQDFSILEIISNGERGLRMPHLTKDQQTAMTASPEFQALKTTLARGLTIYNMDADCLEFWDGSGWVSLCDDGITQSDKVSVTACTESNGTNPVSANTGYYMYTYQTMRLYANSSDGTPASYQWLVDGVPVTGATNATYSYTPPASITLQEDDWGNYKKKVIVTCRMVVAGSEVQPVNDFEILVIKADKNILSPIYVSTVEGGIAGGTKGTVAFAHVNLGSLGDEDPCSCLGDLYQWGRSTDGHEKRTSQVIRNIGAENNEATLPTEIAGKFIGSSSAYDWRAGSGETSRWGDGTQNENVAKAANDPCPAGWKVPSQKQWISIYHSGTGGSENAVANKWQWSGNGFMVGSALFLPAAGWRSNIIGTISEVGTELSYWSSTVETVLDYSYGLIGTSTAPPLSAATPDFRSRGSSVRCIKE